jgi:hypothetical protein
MFTTSKQQTLWMAYQVSDKDFLSQALKISPTRRTGTKKRFGRGSIISEEQITNIASTFA